MTPDSVLSLGRDAGLVILFVAGPLLLASLLTGLAISLFQAVTQIQEMSLSFIPKMIVMLVVVALLGHWMLGQLVGFTTSLLLNLPMYGR